MKQHIYSTINVNGRVHVLCESTIRPNYNTTNEFTGKKIEGKIPEANYLNTGMALCGVIDKGDTLQDWIDKLIILRVKNKYYH